MKNIINEWLMKPIKKATLLAGGRGFEPWNALGRSLCDLYGGSEVAYGS